MKPDLGAFERLVRLSLGLFAFFAAAVLFAHPLARLAVAVFGLLCVWEAFDASCRLHAALGMRAPGEPLKRETLYLVGLVAVQLTIAYEWWSAGWEKLASPDFVGNIEKTLGAFASKNPFPWYKSFLEGAAMDNAKTFAYAVEWSQIAVSLALAAGGIAILLSKNERTVRQARNAVLVALLGGLLMNANFYLAAGWTGPGTKGSNVVMFWVQAALAYVWLALTVMPKESSATNGVAQ
ncbi:hypothetical protein HY633_01325 [Candidatus Uhrbacteria bacterium]|nr:hypothetical protein [Candidatus Uhrbacteria bacterium]